MDPHASLGGAPTITSPFARPRVLVAPARKLRASDPTHVGRYRVTRRLGEGGMGVVFAAEDPQLQRTIAIKLVRPQTASSNTAKERLVREAQAMGQLNHPNVVAVYDAGRFAEGVYIAMELIDGQSLHTWLKRQRRWREVVATFVGAARGLAAAHDVGLVHRDFKPANVMVGADGSVKVLDFGLARAAGLRTGPPDEATPTPWAEALTAEGMVLGTPAYMAPEQVGAADVDGRTDQFSFCVALYEALWGVRPFSGDSWPALAAAITRADVPAPPRTRVPAYLERVVRKGLSRDPAARFADMHAVIEALERVPASRRRLALVAGVASGAVALAAIGALAGGSDAAACDPEARLAAAGIGTGGLASLPPTARRSLDAYVQAWSDTYRELCTTVQDGRELDLHMRCLSGRLDAAAAAAQVLTELSSTATELDATAVIDGLPDVEVCADAVAVQQRGALPGSAADAAALGALERDVARARALLDAGRAQEALAEVERIVLRAEQAGFAATTASVFQAHGDVLRTLGQFEPAREAYEVAYLAASESRDERRMFAVASQLVELMGALLGEHSEAARWRDEAEAILGRGAQGARDVGRFHNRVGAALLAAGDVAGARDRHQRALGLLEAEFGREDRSVAETLDQLASATSEQGDYAEAERLQRRALEIQSAELGEEHPTVASGLNDLGSYLQAQRRHDEAEAAFRRAHALLAAAYGEDNNRALKALGNAGIVVASLGRYAEAKTLFERVLAVQERELGRDHPETVATILGLAEAERNLGDRDRAEALLLRGVGALERVHGPEHISLALALNTLAALYSVQDEDEHALAVFERVLAIRRKALPAEHPHIGATHYNLAVALHNLERFEDAIPHFEAAISIDRRAATADPASVAGHEIGLATTLRVAGKHARAIEVLRRALPVVERAAADDPWFARQLADGRFCLARCVHTLDPSAPEAIAAGTAARDYYQRSGPRHLLEAAQTWLASAAK